MKELREGFTTGTCAAIASKAAARMIFEKRAVEREKVLTPSGRVIETEILEPFFDDRISRCAVRKDAGDDPDVTDALLIFAELSLKEEKGIEIDGGKGVGRVTKPGLQQKVGEAAINKVPREMIRDAVSEVFREFSFEGGAKIVISVPGGEERAKKTFNPRLGIEGGISILGSSGIVKPMSEEAIIETVKAEIDIKAEEGGKLILTPGNYGRDFIRDNYGLDINLAVLCSNHIGEALDYAAYKGFKDILLVGHSGKLIKLSGGIMNTHSRNADCRMELIASSAAFYTGDVNVLRQILEANTTEEAFDILENAGILNSVMERMGERALFYIRQRLREFEGVEAGLIIFSGERGVLYEDKPYRGGARQGRPDKL